MSDREAPDTELSLPKATIQKITSEILGDKSGVSLNKEARDLLIECCVEFVQLISSEANEIADKEHKKTIAVEHIEQALKDLDFPEYIKPVLLAAGEEKEQKKNRERRTWKAAASGKTDAELEAEQLEMMRQAREKYNTGHDSAVSPT